MFGNFSKLRNIWKILQAAGKKKITTYPVVLVTNAAGEEDETASVPVYYFYVDDYFTTADFDIKFKVNWTPETVTIPNELTSLVVTGSSGIIYSVSNPAYKTEYTCNVTNDFMQDGALRTDMSSREYTITATDSAEHTHSAIVRFLVREAFMLN
jgi:hypothetical protein